MPRVELIGHSWLLLAALVAFGASRSVLAENMPAQSLPFDTLAQRRVFFGHQSVGGNILDGLRAQPGAQALRLVESADPAVYDAPVLAHASIGRNEDPSSKLRHFAKLMRDGHGGRADIAFFKFCYIDFHATTDIRALFDEYARTFAALSSEFPKTRFVHVTVPLVAVQRGWKARIKNLIGKGAWGELENVRRHEFNELLRVTYAGKAPLFDLAKLESTSPGGGVETFERDGRTYPSLHPGYTDDAQHLNARGSEWVARELVTFLASLPPQSTTSPALPPRGM